MYCGVDIIVQDAISLANESVSPQHFLVLAVEAEKGGNYESASAYYLKTLEIDPQNYSAWHGNGTCAGWQSNLSVCRFGEMMNSYRKALEVAPSDAIRDLLKMDMAASGLLVARAYFNLSLDHTLRFIAIHDAQFDHANRTKNAIELCEFAISLDSNLSQAKDFIADIASRAAKIIYLSSNEQQYFKSKASQYAAGAPNKSASPVRDNSNVGAYIFVAIYFFICYVLVGMVFDITDLAPRIFVTLIVSATIATALAWIGLPLVNAYVRFSNRKK